jgi:ankyrin repeat protein
VDEIRVEIAHNPGSVNAKNAFGQSPLFYAISNGGLETVRYANNISNILYFYLTYI